jgi:hypothetical protein
MKSLDILENYFNNNVYPFDDSECKKISSASKNCFSKNNVVFTPLGPKGKIGVPYKYIQCKNPTKITILKASKYVKPFLNKLKHKNVCKTFNACNLKNDNLNYCGMDEFTNESIIGLAIADIVKDKSNSFVKQYSAYICNKQAFNHMEMCDYGDMSQDNVHLSNKTLTLAHCLLQISKILHILQIRSNYTHGNLKAGNIFITNTPTITKIGKRIVKSPVTFKLADYGKSCITLKNYRLFNDKFIRHFMPRLKLKSNNNLFILNKFRYLPSYYRSQLLFSYSRHAGMSFYGDLDVYVLIASLLLNNTYGKYLLDFPKKFHETLWISSQINLIEQHISTIKSKVPNHRLSSVTVALQFLTTKLQNGKYIVMKKNISNKIFKVLFEILEK